MLGPKRPTLLSIVFCDGAEYVRLCDTKYYTKFNCFFFPISDSRKHS